MRITGGKHRGRPLSSPEGLQTRPTSDRTREAIFNIIMHAKWRPPGVLEDGHILDLFAGTGALGLDALSRGAAQAIFVERDPAALRACEKNIGTLGAKSQSIVMRADATLLGPRPAGYAPRTLVFLDPPYGKNLGAAALLNAAKKNWLAENAVCVLEMSKKAPEDTPSGFEMADERDYGIARVRFMIYRGEGLPE
jgi:16S rRNA (guanine966-N2)-methyltransferase